MDAGTGEVVTEFSRSGDSGPFVNTAVWEDNEHVLATVFEDSAWTVVRLGLDGSIEAATDALPDSGDPRRSPFSFSTRP